MSREVRMWVEKRNRFRSQNHKFKTGRFRALLEGEIRKFTPRCRERVVQQSKLADGTTFRVPIYKICISLRRETGLEVNYCKVPSRASYASADLFPECVARVPVSSGGLGVRLCSRKVVSVFATVRNRSQPSATVRNRLRVRRKALHSGECVWSGSESASSWFLVVAVILAFAGEVSAWLICVAADMLVFAEEAVILAFAEEVFVWVLCVAAIILAFAEEVSVWVICVAAVVLVCVAAVI